MDVIVLDGELEDPKIGVRGRGEGAAHGREDAAGPEAVDRVYRPERHVHGMARDVVGASPVGHAGPPSRRRFAPGAEPSPTPGAGGGKGQLDRSTVHR